MLVFSHKIVFIKNEAAFLCVTMRERARAFAVFHLPYSKYKGVKYIFTSVVIKIKIFHSRRTRVVCVALVSHSCCTRVDCVSLVSHSCHTRVSLVSHSCCSRVALVSHSYRTRVVRVWHSCCKLD